MANIIAVLVGILAILIYYIFLYHKYGVLNKVSREQTYKKDFQHQVILQAWDSKVHLCSGSIIDEKWILTAATCTKSEKRHYYVRIGTTNNIEGGFIYNISQIIVHPKFEINKHNYDISLLQLTEPIKISTRTSLIDFAINGSIIDYPNVIVSGWQNNEIVYNELNTTELKSCLENCKEFTEDKTPNNMFCDFSGSETFRGEFGSPVTLNGKKQLVGITTGNVNCISYINISPFSDWIKNCIN